MRAPETSAPAFLPPLLCLHPSPPHRLQVQNPDPDNRGNDIAVSIAAVFAGVSLVFSLMVIVVSVIYLIEVRRIAYGHMM